MSLNYDTRNVSPKTIEDHFQAECFGLCVALMTLGVSRIEDSTIPLILARLEGFAAAEGGPLFRGGDPLPMLQRWRGLHVTNTPAWTDAKFLSDMNRRAKDNIRRAYDKAKQIHLRAS